MNSVYKRKTKYLVELLEQSQLNNEMIRQCAAKHTYITYIIGLYNPSVRIIDIVSHTTYVVCINSYTYSLKSTPNDRFFFSETFHINFICSQKFCLLRGNRRRNIFCISFYVRPGAPTLAWRLISQHTAY